MLWAGVVAGWSHLLNAAGIGRVGPICAADFTAGSRRLIYECTGRTGPAWLKRERWKYNGLLFISKYLHLLCTWSWKTDPHQSGGTNVYKYTLFSMESFPFVIFLWRFHNILSCSCYNGTVSVVCFHGSWLCGRRTLIYNLAAFVSFKKW